MNKYTIETRLEGTKQQYYLMRVYHPKTNEVLHVHTCKKRHYLEQLWNDRYKHRIYGV